MCSIDNCALIVGKTGNLAGLSVGTNADSVLSDAALNSSQSGSRAAKAIVGIGRVGELSLIHISEPTRPY